MKLRCTVLAAALAAAVTVTASGQAAVGRKPISKTPTAELRMTPGSTGRLIVKFRDDVKARLEGGNQLASLTRKNLDQVQQIVQGFGLSMDPAVKMPSEKIARLESRAAAMSGKPQPDLAGLMYVNGPEAVIEVAAKALNGLEEVEFVQFELQYTIPEPQEGGKEGGTGRCCRCDGSCDEGVTQAACEDGLDGGKWGGPGSTCAGGCPQPDPNVGVCCVPGKGDPDHCIGEFPSQLDAETCEAQGGLFIGGTLYCNCGFGGVACPPLGACCDAADECRPTTEGGCVGDFLGLGTNCVADEVNCALEGCGDPANGSCFECHIGSPPSFEPFNLFCDDQECCELVCTIDPWCCDDTAENNGLHDPSLPRHWDSQCVDIALEVCLGFDPCGDKEAGSCFETHPTPGCQSAGCCAAVCDIRPSCCTVQWDFECVEIAFELCASAFSSDPTPDFTAAQGYLNQFSYDFLYGGIPVDLVGSVPEDPCASSVPFIGYTGEGFSLDQLWEFGNVLLDLGAGTQNQTRGETVNVGVIEFSAFADFDESKKTHEDLRGKVIAEPGQTIIISPGFLFTGDHGTACLGIIGAKDQGLKGHSLAAVTGTGGEVGCVGIAPDAGLYFFPIVSIEEGGRLINAISNALDVFEPGDVLSFSIGPGCSGDPNTPCTLAGTQTEWMMLRMAADLGVTCVVSAGNCCQNVDNCAQSEGEDCGVIIAGACTPGAPFCRLGFSNFCNTCDGANVVNMSAWGTAVATLGYADMFFGADPMNSEGHLVRSYTNTFGGTSASAPQLAALAANLQGLSKQFYGIPLTPEQIRFLISANGYYQCGQTTFDDIPGSVEDFPCLGSFNQDETADRIGGNAQLPDEDGFDEFDAPLAYPDPQTCGESLVASRFFDDSDLVDGIIIVRGSLEFGNIFSLLSSDNNYLRIESQHTDRSHHPALPGPPGQVAYLGTGQTVDLIIDAHSDIRGNTMDLVTEVVHPQTQLFPLMFIEMYDWIQRKWTFVDFELLNIPGTEEQVSHPVVSASRFIDANDGNVLIRLYVLAVGKSRSPTSAPSSGPNSERVTVLFDWVNLHVGQTFGQNPIPPG